MESTIKEVKTELISLFWTITEINEVSWFLKQVSKYPNCIIKYRGTENESIWTGVKYRKEHNFEIYITYDYEDDEDAEEFTMDLSQKSLDLINLNQTLNWKVSYARINWIIEETIEDTQKEKMIIINLTAIIQ